MLNIQKREKGVSRLTRQAREARRQFPHLNPVTRPSINLSIPAAHSQISRANRRRRIHAYRRELPRSKHSDDKAPPETKRKINSTALRGRGVSSRVYNGD